jgi:TRAP-type mannitol/chloroaromatic compound transport system permease small subunit
MSAINRPVSGHIVNIIDTFSEYTGRAVSWLTIAMMLLSCVIVVLRYGFNIGSVALQESMTYLHATVFLLAAAYTFKNDGHVRVDIFYREYSPEGKAWVNALGNLIFLIPMCSFLLITSWGYVANSWAILEGSPHANGIPALFLLKSLIPLAAITLILQAIADTLRSFLLLTGNTLPADKELEEEQHHGGVL